MKKQKSNRVPTYIPNFDTLINGGFKKNSINLIVGGAGSGKTIFTLQFLVNGILKHNETGLYITFEEKKDEIYDNMSVFGWDLAKLEKQGKLVKQYRNELTELEKSWKDKKEEIRWQGYEERRLMDDKYAKKLQQMAVALDTEKELNEDELKEILKQYDTYYGEDGILKILKKFKERQQAILNPNAKPTSGGVDGGMIGKSMGSNNVSPDSLGLGVRNQIDRTYVDSSKRMFVMLGSDGTIPSNLEDKVMTRIADVVEDVVVRNGGVPKR